MAASYGLEYVWPMLDTRLVQQWLSTPSLWKLGDGGIRRFLHRRAVEGVCPDKVIWKAHKDMGFAAIVKRLNGFNFTPLLDRQARLLDSMPSALEVLIEKARINSIRSLVFSRQIQEISTYQALLQTIRALDELAEWV